MKVHKIIIQVLIDGIWQIGPTFSLPLRWAQTITCNGVLYGHIIAHLLL